MHLRASRQEKSDSKRQNARRWTEKFIFLSFLKLYACDISTDLILQISWQNFLHIQYFKNKEKNYITLIDKFLTFRISTVILNLYVVFVFFSFEFFSSSCSCHFMSIFYCKTFRFSFDEIYTHYLHSYYYWTKIKEKK